MKGRFVFVVALIILAFGTGLLAMTIVHAVYYAPQKEVVLPGPPFSLATSSIPVRIVIPKIEVDAEVEKVGITFKGNMSTPKKLHNTGWYKYGTLPGEKGSAVIDGHVDNGFGLGGVFKNLKKLSLGDDVYVETEDGNTLHFVVFEIENYYYKDVPREILFNRSDGAYLNLITCDGEWIPEEETADRRIVVYTQLSN